MEANKAGGSLESLISSFDARIRELQELVVARNTYPASSITDLSAVDSALKVIEQQVDAIKNRLREEAAAVPKAKKLIDASLLQQRKLQNMFACLPSYLPERMAALDLDTSRSNAQRSFCSSLLEQKSQICSSKREDEPSASTKEKKNRSSPPHWYITSDELDSLNSYMRGRLNVEKVNAAINDMATYAEANAQLLAAPRKKLSENLLEKVLELRDIALNETVKGKHFFLETDIKGPSLKLDNTGRSILTVLRHLGRISESRIGHHRVFIILKP